MSVDTIFSPPCDALAAFLDPVGVQVSLRTWAGQDACIAAEETGVSLGTYLARRRRLELPVFRPPYARPGFDPGCAEQTYISLGYHLVQCQGFSRRGVTLFFWKRRCDHRLYSNLARSLPWFLSVSVVKPTYDRGNHPSPPSMRRVS